MRLSATFRPQHYVSTIITALLVIVRNPLDIINLFSIDSVSVGGCIGLRLMVVSGKSLDAVDNSYHPCMHLCIYPSIYLAMHPFMHACMHPCMHLCIYPSIYLAMHPFMHASIHACICASIHPSI